MRFDPKISGLEERTYIDSLSMDELHGIFTAYEMRIEKENPVMKECWLLISLTTSWDDPGSYLNKFPTKPSKTIDPPCKP
jgi:hypothetical protein